MSRRNRSRLAAGIVGLLAAGLVIMIQPSPARAAVDADVRAGVYPDADAVAVGAGILTDVGGKTGWYFNPNVEVALGDRRDIVALSGDFHYDFNSDRNTSVWLGGGPAVLMTNHAGGEDETDLGVNVLTGIGAKRGDVRPFAQLRGTMGEQSQVAIAGGIRF
jgi:hypothetical protein